jgi:Flp pilus assembly pilin Flp
MATLLETVLRLKIWKDNRGQELVEYALLAGFLVTISGAVSPAVAGTVSTVFSRIVGALDVSGGGSGTIQ